jgi:two-component system OmpR family response regulator
LGRRRQPHPEVLLIADLEIWGKAQRAHRAGRPLRLTPKEFELLLYLGRNEGILVTRRMLLEHVFRLRIDPGTNVVDVHIHRLREKLDKGFAVPLLHTVRGEGYVLKATASA